MLLHYIAVNSFHFNRSFPNNNTIRLYLWYIFCNCLLFIFVPCAVFIFVLTSYTHKHIVYVATSFFRPRITFKSFNTSFKKDVWMISRTLEWRTLDQDTFGGALLDLILLLVRYLMVATWFMFPLFACLVM